MPRLLKDLSITDVSSVTAGAGRGVKVMLMKSATKRETQQEAKMPTNTIDVLRKGIASGELSGQDVHAMLDAVIEKLHDGEEFPQQTLARVTDWRSPRYDRTAHELLALDVEFGKAAPAGGPYGHGKVKTTGNNFDARSGEGEQIASDGLRGGPEGNAKLQAIADAQKAWRKAVDKIMADSGVSRSKATLMLSETPEGRLQFKTSVGAGSACDPMLRRFTVEEIATIKRMAAEGASGVAIAQALDCTAEAIRKKCVALGIQLRSIRIENKKRVTVSAEVLATLKKESDARGITPMALANRLLSACAKSHLCNAVLDDFRQTQLAAGRAAARARRNAHARASYVAAVAAGLRRLASVEPPPREIEIRFEPQPMFVAQMGSPELSGIIELANDHTGAAMLQGLKPDRLQ